MADQGTGQNRRCGFIAVIGAPNAGKSTLVNAIVGAHVSIVTHKVQTTRFQVRGVATRGDVQLALVDTPGIFAPKRRLDRAMVRAAWMGAQDADAIVHVVDAPAESRLITGGKVSGDARSGEDTASISEGLNKYALKAVLVLNKIDAMPRDALFAVADVLFKTGAYSEVFMISAKNGDGVKDLHARLEAQAPEGPWMYPEDQLADLQERLIAAEITREKVMLRLHDELPYETTVETDSFKDQKDGSTRIEQTLYVARDSQKGIALGHKGETIKAIGTQARKSMEEFFDRRVHLFLNVKVAENWSEDPRRYSDLGLDYES
ncbi:MAG: GTPase Era [Caulobacterales bacterium]